MNPLIIFGAIQVGLIAVALISAWRMVRFIPQKPWFHGIFYALSIGLINRVLFLLAGLQLSGIATTVILMAGNTILPMLFYLFLVIGFVQLYTTLRIQSKQLLVKKLEQVVPTINKK